MKKTVLITGATSGFGEACARLFANSGYKLILTGRRSDRLKKLRQDIAVDIHTITQDVRDKDAVKNDLLICQKDSKTLMF